jgi:hypothetical protein
MEKLLGFSQSPVFRTHRDGIYFNARSILCFLPLPGIFGITHLNIQSQNIGFSLISFPNTALITSSTKRVTAVTGKFFGVITNLKKNVRFG